MADFQVSIDGLKNHSSQLRGLSSQAHAINSVVSHMPGGEMFGVLCSPILVPPMSLITGLGGTFMTSLGKGLTENASQIQLDAHAYQAVENEAIEDITSIGL